MFGTSQLAPVSTAVSKSTSTAFRPLPEWVQRVQAHYQQLRQQYKRMIREEDTEMIDSIQARISRLDQEVQNLINRCNSKREV
jgi:predicted PurR-regulated permease PerM